MCGCTWNGRDGGAYCQRYKNSIFSEPQDLLMGSKILEEGGPVFYQDAPPPPLNLQVLLEEQVGWSKPSSTGVPSWVDSGAASHAFSESQFKGGRQVKVHCHCWWREAWTPSGSRGAAEKGESIHMQERVVG